MEEPEQRGVQHLHVAVLPKDVLLPEPQGARLVQHVAVRKVDEKNTHIRRFVVTHLVTDRGERGPEVDARVGQRHDDVTVVVVAQVHQSHALQHRLVEGLVLDLPRGGGVGLSKHVGEAPHEHKIVLVLGVAGRVLAKSDDHLGLVLPDLGSAARKPGRLLRQLRWSEIWMLQGYSASGTRARVVQQGVADVPLQEVKDLVEVRVHL
mmetsp:Transcript_46617/g.123108  ORF Transcript_46617/g.123108 Transcript_46617/m.123108 type:complete len:207 (+) Transcript_46617:383-1003(+)